MRYLLLALFMPLAASAQDRAGAFDYYVLALSWSPTWCALEGHARGAAQCDRALGWTLHGLWPQYENGWPSDCATGQPGPTRGQTAAMTDIMGSAGLAWHQWRKHGRCSGLSGPDYLALSRLAYGAVTRPALLRELDRAVRIDPSVIEAAFLEANPGLDPDGLTITCKSGRVAEARLCLTRDLAPRRCGEDVRRDCRLGDALFAPIAQD